MKNSVIFLLLFALLCSCASKDFRDHSKDVLVCSVLSDDAQDGAKTFITHPVLLSWKDLDQQGKLYLFQHGKKLKSFAINRFKELSKEHYGIVVWNFESKGAVKTNDFKTMLEESVKVMSVETGYSAPSTNEITATVNDYIFVYADEVDDYRYKIHHTREQSYNRTFLVKKGMDQQETATFCLSKLEEDPPQVQEDEILELQELHPL